MSTIEVTPVVADDPGYTSLQVDTTLRIKILDLATGRPLSGAYATKPIVHPFTLNLLGKHPLQVLGERDVTLWHSSMGDMTLKVKSLRTYVPDPLEADPVTKLKQTWQTTPEVCWRG